MVSVVVNLVLGIILGINFFKNPGEDQVVTVINIVDGDTVDFNNGVRGRLIGIDAPEYPKGCLSKRAKERLEELLLGKQVEVINTGKRSFERDLVWVRVDGVSVNKVMVTEGLATKDKGYTDEIDLAEMEAVKTKRGIWSSECTAEQKGCVIKGNYRSDTKEKKYHLPGCYNYEKISINSNEGDKWFCKEEDAKEVGFEKSKDCPES